MAPTKYRYDTNEKIRKKTSSSEETMQAKVRGSSPEGRSETTGG